MVNVEAHVHAARCRMPKHNEQFLYIALFNILLYGGATRGREALPRGCTDREPHGATPTKGGEWAKNRARREPIKADGEVKEEKVGG